MKAQLKLEHDVWKFIKADNLRGKKILVACSGGADSVALARVLWQVLPSDSWALAHVHHGTGNDEFRAQARDFVAELAKKWNVPFFEKKHTGRALKSEAAMREFRREALRELAARAGAEWIALGHHQQDLFETRFLRLLRGTSHRGFAAMERGVFPWYRPFLGTDSREIRAYLHERKQKWLEDPSNAEERYLRNWLRRRWLPLLEKRSPGAVNALSRSFNELASASTAAMASAAAADAPIDRREWELANHSKRLALIVRALDGVGAPPATRGQLEEIARRLDNRRRVFSFRMQGSLWSVLPQHICVEKA